MRLEDNKPYIEGYASDECEEEVDDEDQEMEYSQDDYESDDSMIDVVRAEGAEKSEHSVQSKLDSDADDSADSCFGSKL